LKSWSEIQIKKNTIKSLKTYGKEGIKQRFINTIYPTF